MNDTSATILNADDDETGRHTRTDILKNAGFTVIEAATGREALEKVKSMPDLVLLDVNLPDINGFEVCRRIREDETTAQIPVLFISATSMDDDARVIGPEGGADGYLIRPVYPQVLISTIRSLLRIRAAESAFLESEERYRMLFEGMSSGVAVYRPVDDGMDFVFVDFNSSGERIDHIDRDKIIGKRVTEVFPGIGEFGLLDILRRVSRTGNPERYPISQYHDNNLSGWRDNYVYRLPSGEIIAIYDDITEQKKAEDALRESNEFLNNLLDYASAPIIIWDPELQITRFNNALERLTGRSEQEVLGKHIELLFPPENRESSLEIIQKTFAGEQLESVEIPILHISGNVRIILWNSTNILAHDGRIISTMAQGQDITERKRAEEEIRSAKAFLDRVVDMSPFAMWISDDEGTVTRVNHSLCEAIRLTPEDIIGRYNVLRDKNLENQGLMDDVRAVFEKHMPARFSIPWKAADAGDTVDFRGARDMNIDVSIFPILDAHGKLTNVVCQWVDITERVRAEEMVEKEHKRLFDVLEALPAMICLIKPDYHIQFANRSFREKFGEVLGLHCYENWVGVDEPCGFSESFTVLQTGKPRRWELSMRDGTIIDMHDFPFTDVDGSPLILQMGIDITDRRRSEIAIRKSEEKYRDLTENMNEIIVTIDKSGKIRYINEAIKRIYAIEAESLYGKQFSSIVHPDDHESLQSAFSRVLNGDLADFTFRSGMAGETRYFHMSARPLMEDDGTLKGVAAMLEDTTQEVLAEEYKAKAFAQIEKNLEYFATLNDQIRNPLSVIIALADMYGGTIKDEILEQANEIDSIVKMLDRGYLESSKVRDFLKRHYPAGRKGY